MIVLNSNIYRTIDINLSTSYQFILGENLLENLADHLGLEGQGKVFIISDRNVWQLYGMKVENSFSSYSNKKEIFILEAGEEEKNYQNLMEILEGLAAFNLTKNDLVLALGGGVVGDIAGLASGLYLRGVSLVLVPTTVLAAVDSSVGGKTAVNLRQGKNLLGLIKQPARVICDINAFETLSDRIFNEGLVEAMKYGFIWDESMLCLFNKNIRNEKNTIYQLIERSVVCKRDIVGLDEKDLGMRNILNFGHTIGHAIEMQEDFRLRHGEAVGLGMLWMVRLSESEGFLREEDRGLRSIECFRKMQEKKRASQLLEELLRQYDLPTRLDYKFENLKDYILYDKKIRKNSINLVVLNYIGRAQLVNMELKEAIDLLDGGYL